MVSVSSASSKQECVYIIYGYGYACIHRVGKDVFTVEEATAATLTIRL